MKVYDAGSIRNVAIVGHGGCGKTQLVSTLLFAAGAVNRIGRVDDGTHRSPTSTKKKSPASTPSPPASPTPSGRKPKSTSSTRRASPTSSATPAPPCASSRPRSSSSMPSPASRCRPRSCGPKPPHSDSPASSSSTASIATAPASTARSSRCAATARARSSRSSCRSARRRRFIGVVDLVKMKAQTFAADGKMTEADIPAALADAAQHAREQLIEMVAEADEQLMETFFAEGTLTQEQLVVGPAHGDDGRQAVSAAVHVGAACHGHAAAARCDRQLCAVAGRARLPHHRQGRRRDDDEGHRHARRTRRSSGRRSPIRSPAASRCCASCPAR